jgi:hypothetical protein
MPEPHQPRKHVIGPDGSPLTIADLPAPGAMRWVVRRKAEVVAAVRGGLLSLEEAAAAMNCRSTNFSPARRGAIVKERRGARSGRGVAIDSEHQRDQRDPREVARCDRAAETPDRPTCAWPLLRPRQGMWKFSGRPVVPSPGRPACSCPSSWQSVTRQGTAKKNPAGAGPRHVSYVNGVNLLRGRGA